MIWIYKRGKQNVVRENTFIFKLSMASVAELPAYVSEMIDNQA